MNAERLLEGAAFLENLQLTETFRFDLGTWFTDWSKIEPRYRPKTDKLPEGFCGTSGCAMGCFAVAGLWGLKVSRIGKSMMWEVLDADGRDDFNAAEAVFDIDEDTAEWLFHADGYHYGWHHRVTITKEMVAARMRHIAAGGTPETWKEPA